MEGNGLVTELAVQWILRIKEAVGLHSLCDSVYCFSYTIFIDCAVRHPSSIFG